MLSYGINITRPGRVLKSCIRYAVKKMFGTLISKIIFVLTLYGVGLTQVKPASEITLTRCWSYAVDGAGEFVSAGTVTFVASSGGRIEALSADGKKLWASELGGEVSSNIVASESSVFVATSVVSTRESTLRSLSTATGVTNWTIKLPDSARHYLVKSNGSVNVVSTGGILQAVDEKTGSGKWQRNIADKFDAQPAINGLKITLATGNKQLFDVSHSTGEIGSMRTMSHRLTALTSAANGYLFVGDERGNILSHVNGSEKPSWKFKSGGEISHLAAAGDHVLAASHDNFVYAILAKNGHVEWKKRLSGRATNIAIVAGKYAIITSAEEQGAMLVELANGRVVSQTILGQGEAVIGAPLYANGQIYLLTNRSISGYSINGCVVK